MPDISMESFTLGTIICRFKVPLDVIDEINNDYDNAVGTLPAHNANLAGKIAEEFKVTDILSEKTKSLFTMCFQTYLTTVQKPWWHVSLENAWINDMRSNEYNPFHYHTSEETDLGLSSVLVLKKPTTYGKEVTKPDDPCNGMLEFVGGQQDTLSIDQLRVNAQPGEFFVFPYTMLHGVYPFNGTEETRRTLSYNCDLLRPPKEEE